MSETGAMIKPATLGEARDLAAIFSKSNLVPADLRGKEADILFIIMTGAEMGLGPMTSLRTFEIIKGRVGMKPEGMVAHVRANHAVEYIRCIESTPTKAVWVSKQKNSPYEARTEFTWEMAQAAGLTSSDMYRKWPAQMLQWRCASIHCKKNHSDVILGIYSTEEVESFEQGAAPVVVSVPATPAVTVPAAPSLVVETRALPSGETRVIDTAPAVKAVKERLLKVGVEDAQVVPVEMLDIHPPPTPPVQTSPDAATMTNPSEDGVVGWGKNATKRLDSLKKEELGWYLQDAKAKAKGTVTPALWYERSLRYAKVLGVEVDW